MKTKQAKIENHPKFIYEKADDVLNIWLSKKKIDYANQEGDVIVHFTQRNEPVYIEILDASKFLKEQSKVLPQDLKKAVMAF